jgi:hypothetical protein
MPSTKTIRRHLIISKSTEKHRRNQATKYFAMLMCIMLARFSCRQRNYLTSGDLVPHSHEFCPWKRVILNKSDRAYINVMSINVRVFWQILLPPFSQLFFSHAMPKSKIDGIGQFLGEGSNFPGRVLSDVGLLALVLHHLCSCCPEKILCMLFGLPPATLCRYLNWGLVLLERVVKGIDSCQFCWPGNVQMATYSDMIESRDRLCKGAFGFVDGLNLPVSASGRSDVENSQYNGWTCSHYW